MADLILYLLRHGESMGNLTHVIDSRSLNLPLSDAGVQQAKMQADTLKFIDFSAIYSSPLLRARQTADLMNQWLDVGITISDSLYEVDLGVLDGISRDDPRMSIHMDILRKWEQGLADIGYPEGETLNDVGERFRSFLTELENNGQRVALVVGHGMLFWSIMRIFCRNNHGAKFMDCGHLSIVSGTSDKLRLLESNISPGMPVRQLRS